MRIYSDAFMDELMQFRSKHRGIRTNEITAFVSIGLWAMLVKEQYNNYSDNKSLHIYGVHIIPSQGLPSNDIHFSFYKTSFSD